jgi:hypothetical protein
MDQDSLIDLERRGWQALSSTPEAAVAFYEQVLDDEVTMLLPGGAVLADRTSILDSMAGQPWSAHRLEDFRVLQLTTDTAIITYSVHAERNSTSYSALMSSVYVRRPEAWKLAFHQQTPR